METRSRKRTESASSSSSPPSPPSGPTTRSAKRGRVDTSTAGNSSNMNANTNANARVSRSRSAARGQEAKPGEGAAENESGPGPSRRGRRGKKAELGRVDKGKGKVKESDVRVSDQDREAVEKGIDIGGGEGEGKGKGNVNDGDWLSRRNLSSSGSSLQGLLRKFGAGLDDVPMGGVSGMHQSGRFKDILLGLRADGEGGKQIPSLMQLCELLSISTEDSLSTFSVESFVPVLVGLLNCESSPEIMLLAARALTHLCDVLPSSCAVVVHYGAVPYFCARLLTIEYMDLAEQSLQALRKISQENPTTCLRAGALMAVLSYLDFFSTGVQRVALATAENMCKKLPSDAADYVMEAVPLLTNLLQYQDAKVLDHASVCLTRIAEAFASSPNKLDELCNHGLVTQAANLISSSNSGGGQASLSTPTYTGLIRLLSTCACGSTLAAKTLLQLGISGILKDVLLGSGVSANSSVSPALSRPLEQIFEIVSLANELLPPLPQGVIPLPASSSLFMKGFVVKQPSSSSRGNQEGTNANVIEASAREKLLTEQPELLQQFGMDLLPVIIQIYGSSVGGPVRHRSLLVIGKLMYFSTSEMIQSLLNVTNISSFLAGILGWKDQHVLLPALHISGILMEKLPGTFSKMFIREGVVHAVKQLILVGKPSGMSAQPSAKKDRDPVSGTSTRSRRCRRHGGKSNANFDAAEGANNQISANLGSPPDSVKTPSVDSDLCMTISTCAKTFKDKHFPSDPGTDDVGVTDDLLRLKSLCTKLNSGAANPKSKRKGKSKATLSSSTDFSAEKEEYLLRVISEMLTEICKGDGVSTFEFIGSGVVEAFLNYFSCGLFCKERIPEANLPKLRKQVHKRLKYFIDVALPSTVDKGRTVPMADLVQKLQNALTSLEHFPVMLSQSPRSSSGNAQSYSGLGALSQHLKLRLCRAKAEKSLRDFSSNVVLIDPLANLASVEEFLWPRVQQGESGQKSTASVGNSEHESTPTGVSASSTAVAPDRRYSTRFRPSASTPGDADKKEPAPEKGTSSSKGKGKAALQPELDTKGPQTRSAARRKAALAEHEKAKTVHRDSTSEGEDLDISPAETDDAVMIEDDDISDDEDLLRDDDLPICTPTEVHDVHLNDSADDNIATPAVTDRQAIPASGSSSRAAASSGSSHAGGALSFAAAAMSGLGSDNGRSTSGGRDCHDRDLFGGSNDLPKLIFNANGKQLNRNLTIYQAIHRLVVRDEDDERYAGSDFASSAGSRLWSDVYTITYQKADAQADKSSAGRSSIRQSKSTTSRTTTNSFSDAHSDQMSLIDSILQGSLPCDLEKSNPTYNILALLRVLESLNELSPHLRAQIVVDQFSEDKISSLDELTTAGARVPQEEFLNSKLTPKLAKQIQDALAICSGSLPSWCYQLTKACPFLFTFETRRQYFYSTSFGLSRTLHRLQQLQGADGNVPLNERELRLRRVQRQKVRVSRNRILDSAAKVMEIYSSQKAVLEVEYFGEVGSGLGPTLEFYTLLSRDLQKVGLGIWRSNSSLEKHAMEIDSDGQTAMKSSNHSGLGLGGNNDVVHAPLGLFPLPWAPKADASDGSKFFKVMEYFRLLGRVMAKVLQDGRLLDLPFSTAFYKLVLGRELNLHDIPSFDAELGKTLQEFHALVCRKKYLESLDGDNREAICNLHFRGSRIEDLCLDFTVPGYPNYILKSGDEIVDIHNLEEYISLVVDATVKTGIMRQMEAFRAGFNQVFDVSSLQIFTPLEVDYLLCGRRELWKADSLAEHIKFDHGYNAKSIPIINLLEIMGQFTPEQQQAFCQFVTGAPRLPPGGLAVLKPKLTVVRKHPSTNGNMAFNDGNGPSESADDDLPSVMTCANYLKLPPYSTKEIMYKKLLYAISEGQGSFDLS